MELKSSLWNQTIERSRIPDECLSEDVIVGIDVQDRLTAKEAMAHKYFDPVREDVEKELAQHRQGTETVSVSKSEANTEVF